jgi:hypothetical protein
MVKRQDKSGIMLGLQPRLPEIRNPSRPHANAWLEKIPEIDYPLRSCSPHPMPLTPRIAKRTRPGILARRGGETTERTRRRAAAGNRWTFLKVDQPALSAHAAMSRTNPTSALIAMAYL